ncbi:efflux RND transporter permease subunit [Lysobacter sp. HDW10]|uniref:efflux RND transporter permease subunit n=1 Tax=Lysobacter sp. HDW10 TaxID=2714936 RepID=UPI00140E1DF0|nr:efflux RND transporter permease subunit [Lysobacter sp. HDW10]QIK81465.1 efflux RND transporter permease subunit [Lysobacter sp. HDW10]
MSTSDAIATRTEALKSGLIEFATRRRVTIAMLWVTLFLFGMIALRDLKVNLLPDLSYPTLTVRTEYTGAAPAEIETLISQPAEEALGVVKNVRKLESVSRTGQSDVVLQFAWGTNMDQAGLDVRDKMEALQLPLDAKRPVMLRFNPSTQPIMRLALAPKVSKPGADGIDTQLVGLRRFADDDLKKKLETVAGVAAVKVGGGLEDEIQVDIDQRKLAQYGLSIDTVINRLKAENVNVSGGRLEQGAQRYLVRTVNQFQDVDAIRNMLLTVQSAGNSSSAAAAARMARIAAASGSAEAVAAASGLDTSGGVGSTVPIHLGDIATVTQSWKERESIIRLDGREAIELAIYKEGDANTVATADGLLERLKSVRSQLPPEVELVTVEDQAVFIRHAISDVKLDAVIGGLLAILVIFLFLRDGWSTFVISLALPTSIVTTFFFMSQLGLSLNVMSLGGLALATGLVVDDSIVVLESIAKARERGLGILQAAVTGTREVGMAVVASTLTTIAVFLPLVFVQGIAGQLFRDQALTVALAVAISLAVSMTLVPMLSALKAKDVESYPEEPPHAQWQPEKKWQKPIATANRGIGTGFGAIGYGFAWVVMRVWNGVSRVVGPVMRKASDVVMAPYNRAERMYLDMLPKAMGKPALVLTVAAAMFVLSMGILPFLGANLMPQLAQDRFEMTVKLPPGTPLATTDALVRDLQNKHDEEPGISTLFAVSGTGTRLDANPTESGENIGKLSVVMANGGNEKVEADTTAKLRESMKLHPNAQVDFARPELFSFSPPLEIEIEGDNLDTLKVAGQKLAALLRNNPHYTDVKSTVEQGFPEIQIHFDQARAAALGLTTRQIADIVVNKVAGNVATRYSFRDRKIDVLVRSRPEDRNSVEAIRNLVVNPGSGAPVTLASVADIVETTGPSEIHRVDQRRVAIISANLQDIDLQAAVREVNDIVAKNPLDPETELHIGGQGEELGESLRSLLFAFGLAVFLVYLVMASQFESLLHPFVILFSIPLALVGAVLALFLTRSTISVVVFIGLILLVGLVVKNAIILIDKVNQLREEGVAKRDALVEGARSRLRPIMMTTLCTLFGFLPLAIATGEGAEVRSPMAITVMGGLLVSTLLTLIVVPVIYDLLDRKPDSFYKERGDRARAVIAAGEANAAEHG